MSSFPTCFLSNAISVCQPKRSDKCSCWTLDVTSLCPIFVSLGAGLVFLFLGCAVWLWPLFVLPAGDGCCNYYCWIFLFLFDTNIVFSVRHLEFESGNVAFYLHVAVVLMQLPVPSVCLIQWKLWVLRAAETQYWNSVLTQSCVWYIYINYFVPEFIH